VAYREQRPGLAGRHGAAMFGKKHVVAKTRREKPGCFLGRQCGRERAVFRSSGYSLPRAAVNFFRRFEYPYRKIVPLEHLFGRKICFLNLENFRVRRPPAEGIMDGFDFCGSHVDSSVFDNLLRAILGKESRTSIAPQTEDVLGSGRAGRNSPQASYSEKHALVF